MIHVRDTTVADALSLVPELCGRDVDELASFYGVTPHEGVMRSLEASELCRSVVLGGRVAGIYGLCAPQTMLGSTGRPWMLTATFGLDHARAWVKTGRYIIAGMHEKYPVLENWADERHTVRLRWLRFMGFNIASAEPFGIMGLPACRFTKVKG